MMVYVLDNSTKFLTIFRYIQIKVILNCNHNQVLTLNKYGLFHFQTRLPITFQKFADTYLDFKKSAIFFTLEK